MKLSKCIVGAVAMAVFTAGCNSGKPAGYKPEVIEEIGTGTVPKGEEEDTSRSQSEISGFTMWTSRCAEMGKSQRLLRNLRSDVQT